MHKMNLRNIDLNLLVVLERVLKERNITRAATQLHMSQPAVSHALSRARELFRDQLLLRSGNEMLLTFRGLEVVGQIDGLLAGVRGMLHPGEFDPAQASGRIRIAGTEGAILVVLARTLATISSVAPGVQIVISSNMTNAYTDLRLGHIDILFDVVDMALRPDFCVQELFSNSLVCAVSAEHIAAPRPVTLANYKAAKHASIDGGTDQFISEALERAGIKRNVIMRLPGFITAAATIANSGLILTIPETLSAKASELFPLRIFKLPVVLPQVTLSMVWHERQSKNPLHKWLREQILQGLPEEYRA